GAHRTPPTPLHAVMVVGLVVPGHLSAEWVAAISAGARPCSLSGGLTVRQAAAFNPGSNMSQGAPLAVAGPASDGPVDYVRRHPGLVLIALLLGTGLALGVAEGWRELGQVTINVVVAGNYFALGAVGLLRIFAVLRLINFAYGEFLTFGAYMLIVGNAVGLPLVVSV